MYAIVRSGGKQYRVEEKGIVTVDKLAGEAGESITLGEVLCIGGTDSLTVGQADCGRRNRHGHHCGTGQRQKD